MVKDKAGNIISNNCDCLNRWKEHYSELLNKDPVPHNPETFTAAANAPTDLSISEGAVTLDEAQRRPPNLRKPPRDYSSIDTRKTSGTDHPP